MYVSKNLHKWKNTSDVKTVLVIVLDMRKVK